MPVNGVLVEQLEYDFPDLVEIGSLAMVFEPPVLVLQLRFSPVQMVQDVEALLPAQLSLLLRVIGNHPHMIVPRRFVALARLYVLQLRPRAGRERPFGGPAWNFDVLLLGLAIIRRKSPHRL